MTRQETTFTRTISRNQRLQTKHGKNYMSIWPVSLSISAGAGKFGRRTPNQTDSDVTFSRSCDQGKITEKDWKISMKF